MRLDQWLWAVRIYQSRTLAAAAVKAGQVRVNDAATKPAHEVKPGERVAARSGVMTRTLRVLDAPPARVAARLVPTYAEDLTPPEEHAKHRERRLLAPVFRPKGSGRPTKRERRATDGLAGE